jgi:hypothetical protein
VVRLKTLLGMALIRALPSSAGGCADGQAEYRRVLHADVDPIQKNGAGNRQGGKVIVLSVEYSQIPRNHGR